MPPPAPDPHLAEPPGFVRGLTAASALRRLCAAIKPAACDFLRAVRAACATLFAISVRTSLLRPAFSVHVGSKSALLHAFAHPTRPSRKPAVVIVPGGGFVALTWLEGFPLAQAFRAQGHDVFVLEYTYFKGEPIGYAPIEDTLSAVDWVRKNRKSRVCVMGFSAGTALVATASTALMRSKFPDVDGKPDAIVLGYGGFNLRRTLEHGGPPSQFATNLTKLVGLSVDDDSAGSRHDSLHEYSPELTVTADYPPSFLFHGGADDMALSSDTTLFVKALERQKVPHEIHVFAGVGHGMSMMYCSPERGGMWLVLALSWMDRVFAAK